MLITIVRSTLTVSNKYDPSSHQVVTSDHGQPRDNTITDNLLSGHIQVLL